MREPVFDTFLSTTITKFTIMFAEAHAVAHIRSIPDAATDAILDASFAGWDAVVFISDPGVDPFLDLDDEVLLHAHAGVMAATVLAQANQMRILDSAIVPDRDLVRPTSEPTGKFNEIEVYTPTGKGERYSVINEAGEEDVVVPSSPFYPGLADRGAGDQPAIHLKLDALEADPYAVGMATATALLQIGIEAGKDVSAVADILNKAWGVEFMFSPGTVVGLSGTTDYASLFSQDRGTDAKRLASWQECSYVRSGQLNMMASDWGPNVHCDFRRVRVAAESMFATSLAMETRVGGVKPVGKITYHVPATSLLTANPAYLFFTDADPSIFPKQERCAAAEHILTRAEEVGIMRALWPQAEPEIAATWAATFETPGSLVAMPVVFSAHTFTGGPLFSASTTSLVKRSLSFATGLGRTTMTTLSSKMASIAEGVIDVKTVGWLARFAAVVEIMRLSKSREDRAQIAWSAWPSLVGEVPRELERSTPNHHMTALKAGLPEGIRNRVPVRSSKIPVMALLVEIGNPATAGTHTVLRGLRRAFAKAQEVAQTASVRDRAGWRVASKDAWLESRLGVLREFWAVQYAALGAVAHCAAPLRNDLRWWVEVSAAVNTFRAGFMRAISVATVSDSAAVYADDVPLRVKPYHAAARLAKTLEPFVSMIVPKFGASEKVSDWADTLSCVTAGYVSQQTVNVPRHAWAPSAADHTSYFVRGASLLASDYALGNWCRKTLHDVATDCEALMEMRTNAETTAADPSANPETMEMVAAFYEAAASLGAAISRAEAEPRVSALFSTIEDGVSEDAWDDFVEAAYDTSHPKHAAAARQLARAKRTTEEAAAASIVRWIIGEFDVPAEETHAAIL